jgi:hypothetical protein
MKNAVYWDITLCGSTRRNIPEDATLLPPFLNSSVLAKALPSHFEFEVFGAFYQDIFFPANI